MLLLIMPVAGIGFLIKYILLSGIERNKTYGSNTDLEFLGLDRHEWGSVHLIISLSFLVLMIIHIILHWNVIKAIFKRMIITRSLRIAIVSILTVASLLMISFPLIIKPEILDREPLHINRNDHNNNSLAALPLKMESTDSNDSGTVNKMDSEILSEGKIHKHQLNEEIELTGSQTLKSVAEKFNIPVGKIAEELNIPLSRTDERLGRLRKLYSFTMDDVRKCILRIKNVNNQKE